MHLIFLKLKRRGFKAKTFYIIKLKKVIKRKSHHKELNVIIEEERIDIIHEELSNKFELIDKSITKI